MRPAAVAAASCATEVAPTGQVGPATLRDVVEHPLQHGLDDLLASCLPGGQPLPPLQLLRSKFKPARKLTAHYELALVDGPRQLAVTWSAVASAAVMDVTAAEEEAHDRQLLAPFTRLAAEADDRRTSLLVAPGDPLMPQLVRLHDGSYLREMLGELAPGRSALAAASAITCVRYRPGQRHVLRVGPGGPASVSAVFVKIDRDDSGARAVSFARALGPVLAQACPGAGLVEPLGYSSADRASVWKSTPGTTLTQALRAGVAGPAALALVGQALRVLHETQSSWSSGESAVGNRSTAHQGAAAEVVSTLRAGEHIDALLPGVGARFSSVARAVLERLEALPEEEARVSHGDVKCDNIMVEGVRIWLLDLDRVGRADPALDLGKLLADLRWWGRVAGVDVAALVPALRSGYGVCEPERWARAYLFAVLFQLKLAARRSLLHSDGWTSQVTAEVAAAASALRVERAR